MPGSWLGFAILITDGWNSSRKLGRSSAGAAGEEERPLNIKVTRKLLDDYRKIKREIPMLEIELEEMKTTDSGIGNSTILDYRTGQARPQSVVGFDKELYGRRKRSLEKKKAQVKAVEQWINQIEDGQTRCIFRMYYIDGMTWIKIADKTGYTGNPDYVRIMIRDKFLLKCGIK